MMRTERFKKVYAGGVCVVVTLAILALTACSNAQVKRTPITPRPTPWFCQMNEAGDDWQCVQDAAQAANPKPARLPSDPMIEAAAVGAAAGDQAGLSDTAATGLAPLADPGAMTATGALEDAPVVVDDASDVLAMPEDGFAVQLVATASREQAEEFVTEHQLTETMTLQLARETEFYYVVLLGTYATFEEAQAAVDGRPAALAEIKPWIRPLLSVQAGLLAARELRAAPEL